jgi:hypothetical protein
MIILRNVNDIPAQTNLIVGSGKQKRPVPGNISDGKEKRKRFIRHLDGAIDSIDTRLIH